MLQLRHLPPPALNNKNVVVGIYNCGKALN